MPIRPEIPPTTDVEPEILAVGGLQNELVEIDMRFQPVEPVLCFLHIGVALIVAPVAVGGEGQTDVGGFA